MTQKIMKLSYHQELQALNMLAKAYKDSHLPHDSNNVYGYSYAPMKEIQERFIAIYQSLVDNGADSSKASKFVNNYEAIASLYCADKVDPYKNYHGLNSYNHKMQYLESFTTEELEAMIPPKGSPIYEANFLYENFCDILRHVIRSKKV